jgi:hypothetical protein
MQPLNDGIICHWLSCYDQKCVFYQFLYRCNKSDYLYFLGDLSLPDIFLEQKWQQIVEKG